MNLDKKTLEGIINADTSTAETNPEEPKTELSLSNTSVPTQEEQENANVVSDEALNEGVQEEDEGPVSNMDATPDSTPASDTEPGSDPGAEPEPIDEQSSDLNSDPNAAPEADPEGVSEAQATKTFTQSQVDEIAGKIRKETREKVTRDLFSRYGVNTAEELDDLFGDAQRFATAQDDFASKEKAWNEQAAARDQELLAVKERVALLESGIDNGRFEDARLILKGKGLDVTAENIAAELATHPEWKKQEPTPVEASGLPFVKNPNPAPVPASQPETPATKISIPTLGNNSADNPQPELSERERALRMFKV